MPRAVKFTNYTKLVANAQKSKKNVRQNKIEAYQTWQAKVGKKSTKLDKHEATLRKALKEIERDAKDKDKTLKRILRLLEGVHKEMKTYKEVPVGQKLPDIPKNTISLASISLVMVSMIAYIAAIKAYMALAEALSSKDKS